MGTTTAANASKASTTNCQNGSRNISNTGISHLFYLGHRVCNTLGSCARASCGRRAFKGFPGRARNCNATVCFRASEPRGWILRAFEGRGRGLFANGGSSRWRRSAPPGLCATLVWSSYSVQRIPTHHTLEHSPYPSSMRGVKRACVAVWCETAIHGVAVHVDASGIVSKLLPATNGGVAMRMPLFYRALRDVYPAYSAQSTCASNALGHSAYL